MYNSERGAAEAKITVLGSHESHVNDLPRMLPTLSGTLFECGFLSDTSSVIVLETKKDTLGGRRCYQLKHGSHSGTFGKRFVEYQKRFKPQLE
jgi:hypothetical protein